MKIVFFGLGSIGKRHIKNIKAVLPDSTIIAIRSTDNNISPFEREYGIISVLKFEEALKYNPDCAFITSPTSLHVDQAILCAQAQLDLFIEKPLGSSLSGVSKLKKIISQKKLICMVGFMMQYHPALLKIKELLGQKVIGELISAHLVNAESLPTWHPNEDYRQGYSAQKKLGGGILLTFSHETDYASWLFGTASTVYCQTKKSSVLQTDVEDSVDVLITYENGLPVSIHLDHITTPPIRILTILGDNGQIFWDYYKNQLEWYTLGQKHTFKYSFERNQLFSEEIKDFFQAIQTRRQPKLSLENAIGNLKIILKAKVSAQKNKAITL